MHFVEVPQQRGLTVTVITEKAGKFLAFEANDGRSEHIELTPRTKSILDALIKDLPGRLHNVHKSICNEPSRSKSFWTDLDAGLTTIGDMGNEFIVALVNQSGATRLYDLFAAAFGLGNMRENPVPINFVVEEADRDLLSFPLELLPIMNSHSNFGADESIEGAEQLERAALRFPAFGAVVTRRLAREFDGRTEIQRTVSGRVPIKIIRNESFYANRPDNEKVSDATWLKEQPVFFSEELWPDDKIAARPAAKLLSRCLRDPRLAFDDIYQPRPFGDQIQHLTCHFTRHSDGKEILGLREGAGEITDLNIDLRVLGSALLQASRTPMFPPECLGPLIFLNACGSGSIDPTGRISLVELLLNWSPARAIVATQTPVDFPLAARFARLVYQNLFDGHPLGHAVHRARWELIDKEQLPFGLFYLLYGNAELKIAT